jgi:hypothetical protein
MRTPPRGLHPQVYRCPPNRGNFKWQGQWQGRAKTQPRRVSVQPHPLAVAPAPVLWRDWSRRTQRRACLRLVRGQQVEVQVAPGHPAPGGLVSQSWQAICFPFRRFAATCILLLGLVSVFLGWPRMSCDQSDDGRARGMMYMLTVGGDPITLETLPLGAAARCGRSMRPLDAAARARVELDACGSSPGSARSVGWSCATSATRSLPWASSTWVASVSCSGRGEEMTARKPEASPTAADSGRRLSR